jgi:hypothetical protein
VPQIEVPLAAGENRYKASYADEPAQKGAEEESRFGDQRFWMNAWEALERKSRRYLPLEEACHHKSLHELSRHELGFLRDRFLLQFEHFARHVLPDAALIKNKVARLSELRTETPDALSDPLLATV